jgi:hypothetical protein
LHFLLSNYKKKLFIYEIKSINDEENSKKDKKEKTKISKTNNKGVIMYNTIDDNSGVVECNGNPICKILFNSVTNNRYTINTLYITCIIIIFSIFYQCNRNKNEKRRFKSFKEDNYNNKESNNKLSEMINQIKKMGNFESFANYHKKQTEINKENKFNDYPNDEAFKDYDGDDDENENDKNNDEEFLEKAYHNYLSNMIKKGKKENEIEDNDDSEEDILKKFRNAGNRTTNRFEERKDQSSEEEEDSEDGRLNTD